MRGNITNGSTVGQILSIRVLLTAMLNIVDIRRCLVISVTGVATLILACIVALPVHAAHEDAAWERMPGQAQSVGVGGDGSVFVVAPRGTVYRWNESAFGWQSVAGDAKRVSVDSNGRPWVVTGNDRIYRLRGQTWQRMPGQASDIGAGFDGSVYAIAPRGTVYKWHENSWSWENIGGNAERVTVDGDGRPWVTTSDNRIYRLRGQTWQNLPGRARDLGAGANGEVWAASPGGITYRWNEDSFGWQNMAGNRVQDIACGPNGEVWVVTRDNRIYRNQAGASDSADEDVMMGLNR